MSVQSCIFLALLCLFIGSAAELSAEEPLTEDAQQAILSHGPWPPGKSADKTNRFSGNASAAALGKILFLDKGLSSSGAFSCAGCHIPTRHFTDGRTVATAVAEGTRNTPSLLNNKFFHWYGWAGSVDTLWGAGLRALLNPIEMAASPDHVARHISASKALDARFKTLIGPDWTHLAAPDKTVLVGKMLSAYLETQISSQSPFDQFRNALAAQDKVAMDRYPKDAIRGLKLFIGQGQCNICHFGPLFSNLEFADIGIPYFIRPGVIDKGRYQGIKDLRTSPYSSLGTYSDDASNTAGLLARHVTLQHRNWGEFKVPSLRNVSRTSPYMHNGSLARLQDVINHYSELDEERLHVQGVALLRPLNLTAAEKADLLAFLKTL